MKIYSLIAIFLLSFVGISNAQLNPASLNLECIKNDTVTFLINSANTPEVVVQPEYVAKRAYLGNGVYEFQYIAGVDYLGLDELSIKYYNPSSTPGVWTPSYTNVSVLVVESSLELVNDFVDVASTPMTIQPLLNDSSSATDLEIISIGNSSNCNVVLIDSATIQIIDIIDEDKLAYVQYVAQDSTGNSDSGMITLRSTSYEHEASSSHVVRQGDKLQLTLTDGNYTSSNAAYGTVNIDNNSQLSYEAINVGSETIVLIDSNTKITSINISVLAKNDNSGFLVDDYIFTGKKEEVLFDVFENDLEDSYFLVDFSDGLMHDTLGMFSYQPLPFEYGYKNFYYTVYNGFEHQTASITIKIDDYSPSNDGIYQFATNKNEAYIIDYNIPVTAFDFSIASNASNGQVTVQGFSADVINDCGTYEGNYIIQYLPNTNYYGSDYFELEFCATESGECNIVKIEMAISQEEDDCDCIANDCIWPGDTNNDGVVNNNDLLSLGYCLGQSGASRDFANVWSGASADDWNDSFLEENVNAKHVDANGDGVITSADLDEIINNLGSSHGLISSDLAPLSSLNLSISSEQDTVYTGEWLFLDLALGNVDFPLEDVQGLSLELNFPASLIDSASFFMDYHDDSYFTHGSPTLELTSQPQEGKIKTAFTRTSKQSISGNGLIATLGFIVEDDLLGFKLKDDTFNFKALANNITIMGLDGKEMRLESNDLELVLKIKDKKALSNKELIVYPNPADEYVNIYSNMADDIDRVEVMSLEGRLMASYSNINSKEYSINTSSLNTGMYLITAYSTSMERSTQKLQVVH